MHQVLTRKLTSMAFRGFIWSSIFRRQLHVISRSSSNIRPSSPTPSKLKQYNIPLHDRMIPDFYIPMVFFYPINSNHTSKAVPDNVSKSDLLKKSLSETLSKYYPFAGRLCSGSYVDCNDQGVHFVDAQIGCQLSEVMEKAPVKEEEEGLGHLFPPRTIWNQLSDLYPGTIMHVQVNQFTCGGIALAVSLCHRLGDALTFCSFLRYWASLSFNSGDHQKSLHLCPRLVYELLPPSYDSDSIPIVSYPDKNWTTKAIVFPNRKLAKLRAAVENEDKADGVVEDQKYTRNELLTALIYRCIVAAVARTNSGTHGDSVLLRSVNVRPLLDPLLPETSVGNFVIPNYILTSTESETKYRTLVGRMREEKKQLNGIKSMEGHEVETKLLELSKKNYRFYAISSMCNFPLYDVMDFGWGKPINCVLVDTPLVDNITLMDTANDGIRAMIGLGEQDMEFFLSHKELLTYASL